MKKKLTRVRSVTLIALAVVVTLVPVSPAAAVPDIVGEATITVVIPDPDQLTRTCTLSFRPSSRVTFLSTGLLVGTANEFGSMRASSTGCTNVSWTSTVTIIDQSAGHPTRSTTGAAIGNPATASSSQQVGYAVGQREAGIVTFTLAASSRLGSFCFQDVWKVSAAGNPLPVASGVC